MNLQIIDSLERNSSVAVLVHGLNLKPSRMMELGQFLSSLGYTVVNLHLTGANSLKDFKSVSSDIWRADIDAAIERAKELGSHLSLFGFSLGGLLCVDALERYHDVQYLGLFSPALSLNPWTNAARFTFNFPNLVVPSGSCEAYRAHWGTPGAAYRSLFEIKDHVSKNRKSLKGPLAGAVFLAKGDELVSYRGVQKWLKASSLENLDIYSIAKEGRDKKRSLRHLIIDRNSAGEKGWEQITETLRSDLEARFLAD